MSALLFRSTNGQSPAVNLREALLPARRRIAGFIFPKNFRGSTPDEIAAFAKLPYHEIAFRVLSKFTAGIIPRRTLWPRCAARPTTFPCRWKSFTTAFF